MLKFELSSFPLLQTKRCLLRETKKEDASQILLLRSNDEVMRYIGKEKLATIEEAEEMIEKFRLDFINTDGISWCINLKGNNDLVGTAGLWRMIKQHYRSEIGYTLYPDYWNHGIMFEVLEEVIRFGFQELGLHSIEANVNPANLGSIRLLEKLGFTREAYFRENYYFRGKFQDSATYSLLSGKS